MKRRTFCGSALAALTALSPTGRSVLAAAAELGPAATDLKAVTGGGREIVLARTDLEALRQALRGALLVPGNPTYDVARKLWNGAFDRHPALIVRCAGVADVTHAVKFARAHDLLLAVRGGGHSMSGQSACDGGLMIDLSAMRGIRVDPLARRAWVEPGVLLGEYDHEAQAYGLASPAGTVTHTGAAGLTLGGGFGRIARKHGLACDNLIEANIITADGEFHRANSRENADLFWGVRGGGGNFGVATSFEFGLHPLGPTVIGGEIEYPIEQARDALRACFDYGRAAPDELAADLSLYATPATGARLNIDVSYSGPPALADKAIGPLRRMGKPVLDTVGPIPYTKLQASIDEGLEFGRRYYIKSGFVNETPDAFIDALIAPFRQSAPPRFGLILQQAGGAIARVAENATAFANRDARYDFLVLTRWTDAGQDAEFIEPVRAMWETVRRFTTGFYVNTAPGEDSSRIRANYRGNYDRLVKLKNRYDPTNLFRLNANIKPTGSAA